MSNPKTVKVFEDLEAYTAFCREYGYKVKPEHLYNKSSRIWRLYMSALCGTDLFDFDCYQNAHEQGGKNT